MSDNEVVLGIFFLVIVIGFVILIFFLVKNRSSLLENNLKITSNEIWSNISEQTVKLNFLKSNLLFGIWQDVSATSLCMIVKDINDQIVGRIICPIASRKRLLCKLCQQLKTVLF